MPRFIFIKKRSLIKKVKGNYMEARTLSIRGIIQNDTLLRIPYFQRRYVWGEDEWARFAVDM